MMDQATKATVRDSYKVHGQDTGSVEVQVALLSSRIKELTGHLQNHKKDNSSRRGLIAMVSQRRKLLDYLARKDLKRYQSLIDRLALRK